MEYSCNKELTLKVIDFTKGLVLELRKGNKATIEVENHVFTGIVEDVTDMGLTLVNQPLETKHIAVKTTMQIKQVYQIALYDIKAIYKDGNPIERGNIYYIISPMVCLHIKEDNESKSTKVEKDNYVKLSYVEHRIDDHFFLGEIEGKVLKIDNLRDCLILESELSKTNLKKDQEYLEKIISKENPNMLITTIPLYAIFTLTVKT